MKLTTPEKIRKHYRKYGRVVIEQYDKSAKFTTLDVVQKYFFFVPFSSADIKNKLCTSEREKRKWRINVRLLRLTRAGWLERVGKKKIPGERGCPEYLYSLTERAKRYLKLYGSFENLKWKG